MPTAKFEADFSSFLNAVDAAQFKLADLSKGSEKVQKTLDAMSDQFSGRALIQEASLMTIAVEKLGGVSKLTADELANVSSKAQAAVEKMQALGYDVPKGLENLAKATEANAKASSDWSSSLSTLTGVLGAIGIDASIRGVINFGKAIIDTADQVQKMSDQTGISAENIQRLQYVASQTGTSMSSMVSAVQNLQEKLGSGDKNLNKALDDLGLSLEEIKHLDAYAAFTAIADAIGQIADPTRRAADAQDAFGRNWKELLPAITAGMQDVASEAAVMSNETIARLDAIGDEWEKLKQRIVVVGGEIIAAGESWSEKFATNFGKANPLSWLYQGATLAKSAMEDLVNPIDQVVARQNALDTATTNYAAKLPKALQPAMDAWQALAESDKAQTKIDADHAQAAARLEAAYAELAQAGEGWRGTIDKINGDTVEAIAYYRDAGVSVSALKQVYSDLGDTAFAAIDKMRAARAKQTAADTKYYEDLVKQDQGAYAALEKVNKEYNDYINKNSMDSTTYQITKIREQADADIKAYEAKYGKSVEYTNARNALADAETQHVMDAVAKETAASDAAMQKSINAAASAANAWYKALDVINGQVVAAAVGQKTSPLQTVGIDRGQTIGGLTGVHPGGMIGGTGGALLGNTDPRVIGLMGQGYTAGEAAAIVGGYGGMISIPFGQRQTALAQAGGLGGVNITVNGSVLGSKDEIARVVGDSLEDLLRRQGYTLPGG
jgi:hypothetical protein